MNVRFVNLLIFVTRKLKHLSKKLSLAENFLSTQLSTIDFYILTKSITSYKKKLLQKLLYIQQKTLSSLMRDCYLPIFTANETIANLMQYELSQEESDLLKAVYTFQSNQIKFENSKSSLLWKDSDKRASLISCKFLLLQLQTVSKYTTSTLRLMKL